MEQILAFLKNFLLDFFLEFSADFSKTPLENQPWIPLKVALWIPLENPPYPQYFILAFCEKKMYAFLRNFSQDSFRNFSKDSFKKLFMFFFSRNTSGDCIGKSAISPVNEKFKIPP